MIRHALAPIYAPAAGALGLPRKIESDGVAITFDDGPHPEGTPRILEILADHGARATFFVIGEQVARRPSVVQAVLAEGHAIALHGNRHRLQLRMTRAALADDLARGVAAIEDAAGVRPQLHRPPYGIYSSGGLAEARAQGLSPLLWSAWGKDWRKFTTPVRIARRAAGAAGPADVILLHDADFYSATRSYERTALALPLILEELSRRGVGTVLTV